MTTPALRASAPDSPSPGRARRPRPSPRPLPFRLLLPAPAVLGFVALLALLGALSYAVGSAAGPVAPGLHPADRTRPGTTDPSGNDRDGTPNMPGMRGMSAKSAERPRGARDVLTVRDALGARDVLGARGGLGARATRDVGAMGDVLAARDALGARDVLGARGGLGARGVPDARGALRAVPSRGITATAPPLSSPTHTATGARR
ncbi:hypothetical protein [Streptomyces sp. WZ-12]|uniref:hypothetical protein n=1 Tax=Streptomyces sp. WZ-12 TaxID=3030210 RepID=UPI0023813E43|nr:hypothetical protein [Streptomyces sp. WZ-12]